MPPQPTCLHHPPNSIRNPATSPDHHYDPHNQAPTHHQNAPTAPHHQCDTSAAHQPQTDQPQTAPPSTRTDLNTPAPHLDQPIQLTSHPHRHRLQTTIQNQQPIPNTGAPNATRSSVTRNAAKTTSPHRRLSRTIQIPQLHMRRPPIHQRLRNRLTTSPQHPQRPHIARIQRRQHRRRQEPVLNTMLDNPPLQLHPTNNRTRPIHQRRPRRRRQQIIKTDTSKLGDTNPNTRPPTGTCHIPRRRHRQIHQPTMRHRHTFGQTCRT